MSIFFLYLSTQDSEYLIHVIGVVLSDIYLLFVLQNTSMNEFVLVIIWKKENKNWNVAKTATFYSDNLFSKVSHHREYIFIVFSLSN